MIHRKGVWLFLLMVLMCKTAYADAEFYGIQMRDEHVAKSLILSEEALTAEEISKGELFNKSVYATASLKEADDQRVNFSVNIFNNSDKVIPADYQYRDYYLVTKEDKKYPLYDPENQFDIDEIQPKTNVTFQPSLGNLVLSKKNIKMVVCSFDLGRTTLVLFPSSKKEMIEKLVPPPMPPAPVNAESSGKGLLLSNLFKGKKAKPAVSDPAQPVQTAQPAQAVASDPAHPDKRVEEAMKKFVYVPSSGLEGADKNAAAAQQPPAGKVETVAPKTGQTFVHPGPPRTDAQVLQYNPSYKFITVNAGKKDGLKKNMLIYVMREGRTVAQARIKQIRDAVSAASIIPDSVVAEVRAGDKISLA